MSFVNLSNHTYDTIKKNLVPIVSVLFLLALWGATNSKPEHITNFIALFFPETDLLNYRAYDDYHAQKDLLSIAPTRITSIYLNFFRSLGPLFVMIISLFLIFYMNKREKFNLKNSFFIIFFLYACFQIIGLYNSYFSDSLASGYHNIEHIFRQDWHSIKDKNFERDVVFIKSTLMQSYYALVVIGAISFLYLIKKNSREILFKYFFYISIAIIFLLSIFFFLSAAKEFLSTGIHVYESRILGRRGLLDEASPTVIGLSRMFLINYICCICVYFYNKNNNRIKISALLTSIFLSTMIFAFQSRGTIIGYVLVNFILIFFLRYNFKKKIFLAALIFFLPVIINISFSIIASLASGESKTYRFMRYDLFKTDFEVWKSKGRIDKYLLKEKSKDSAPTAITRDPVERSEVYSLSKDFSTGRFYDWVSLFKFSRHKPLFGYGPLADRYLVASTAANALVYATICGGYLGAICIFCIYLLALLKITKLVFKQNIFATYDKIYLKASILIVLFILFRGLFESSIAVYGTDFLIFIICFSVIDGEANNLKSKNYAGIQINRNVKA